MEKDTIEIEDLQAVLAQRALDLDYQLDNLEPGSEEWNNVIAAQSKIHQDLLAYDRNSIEAADKAQRIAIEKDNSLWKKIGIFVGAAATIGAAVVRTLLFDHAVAVQKEEVVPRDTNAVSSDIERKVESIGNNFREAFRR